MNPIHQLVSIFCEIDDFCKELDDYMKHSLLGDSLSGQRGPECSLSISEIMTILIMFQRIQFKNFKTFYCGYYGGILASLFSSNA